MATPIGIILVMRSADFMRLDAFLTAKEYDVGEVIVCGLSGYAFFSEEQLQQTTAYLRSCDVDYFHYSSV